MCQTAITLVSKSLYTIDNDERLLKIKGVIALFVQTMAVSFVFLQACRRDADTIQQSWGYSVDSLDKLLLTIFDKYAQLLKERFSDDFQEVSHTRFSSAVRRVGILLSPTFPRRLSRQTTTCPCQSTIRTNTTRSSTSVGTRQRKTASSKRMCESLEMFAGTINADCLEASLVFFLSRKCTRFVASISGTFSIRSISFRTTTSTVLASLTILSKV